MLHLWHRKCCVFLYMLYNLLYIMTHRENNSIGQKSNWFKNAIEGRAENEHSCLVCSVNGFIVVVGGAEEGGGGKGSPWGLLWRL